MFIKGVRQGFSTRGACPKSVPILVLEHLKRIQKCIEKRGCIWHSNIHFIILLFHNIQTMMRTPGVSKVVKMSSVKVLKSNIDMERIADLEKSN